VGDDLFKLYEFGKKERWPVPLLSGI